MVKNLNPRWFGANGKKKKKLVGGNYSTMRVNSFLEND